MVQVSLGMGSFSYGSVEQGYSLHLFYTADCTAGMYNFNSEYLKDTRGGLDSAPDTAPGIGQPYCNQPGSSFDTMYSLADTPDPQGFKSMYLCNSGEFNSTINIMIRALCHAFLGSQRELELSFTCSLRGAYLSVWVDFGASSQSTPIDQCHARKLATTVEAEPLTLGFCHGCSKSCPTSSTAFTPPTAPTTPTTPTTPTPTCVHW